MRSRITRESVVRMSSLISDEGFSHSHPTHEPTLMVGSLVSTQTASNVINTGLPNHGRMSAADSKDGGGSGAGVTPDHNQVEAAEHRHSTWKTVLSILPTDIQALAEGRRLRAGNRYRDENTVIDVRGLHNRIPADRLPFAVTQIARVCSVHGRVELLVHPGESWAFDRVNFPGLRSIGIEPHADGLILVFSRVNTATLSGIGKPLKRSAPPEADVVVLGARCRRDDARRWSVTVRIKGQVSVHVSSTTSLNPGIARMEAIASVLQDLPQETTAIPADGMLCQHLLFDTRATQVAFHDALNVLRQWSWFRFGDGWLFGRIRHR